MNILEVFPENDNMLIVKADDGQTGLFDITPYLESEAFIPLKDKREFKRVYNGKYFIEWECGADLSADTIFANWRVVNNN